MNYSGLNKFDIANGEGVRVSLFVSGCQFHCPGCFNSEAWDYRAGKPFDYSAQLKVRAMINDPNVSGLSILGGDPLWQSPDDMSELWNLCAFTHKLEKTVWIWSGFTWEQVFAEEPFPDKDTYFRQRLIEQCDVWVDGLFDESKKDLRLKWRGSSNQRVIDVKKSLKEKKVVLYEE